MSNLLKHYGPWALIAGGSEGIGLCFARRLAEAGINLLLLARRAGPLEAAGEALEADYPVEVHTHAADLTSGTIREELEAITAGLEIGLLVYNAGAAHGAALFHDEPLEQAQKMVALNCTGPLLFAHHLGTGMRERGRGGIILLSSMAGLGGSGYIATYAATKAFDIALAEGLWAELTPHGVHVLGLVAGSTDTPAMADAGIDFQDGEAMDPDEVAREGLERLPHGPLHIAGEHNRAVADFMRSGERRTPVSLVTQASAALFGLQAPTLPGPEDR